MGLLGRPNESLCKAPAQHRHLETLAPSWCSGVGAPWRTFSLLSRRAHLHAHSSPWALSLRTKAGAERVSPCPGKSRLPCCLPGEVQGEVSVLCKLWGAGRA